MENAIIRGSAEDDFDFVHLVSGMNHFDSSQKVFLVPFFRLEKVRVSLSMPSLVPDRSSQALFSDVSCQWDSSFRIWQTCLAVMEIRNKSDFESKKRLVEQTESHVIVGLFLLCLGG